MKKIILSLALVCGLCACSDNTNTYDEMPETIQQFISHYWPNPEIESYTHPSANLYAVDIKNGPSIEFDASYSWTDVDGDGLPLPGEFLYDQLPSPLYQYLEGGGYLNQVFEAERNSKTYELDLLNFDLTYDIATGTIRQD